MASAISCAGRSRLAQSRPASRSCAVHLFLLVFRVQNSIGDKDDGVAGLRGHVELFVGDIGKHAQRKALGLDRERLAGAAEDGLHGAGVGHLQRLVLIVPEREQHGDVLRFELALLQRVVEHGQHLRRARLLLRPPSA